jgi:hypothetical protein
VRHGAAREFRRAFLPATTVLDVKRRAMDAFAIEQSACDRYRLFRHAIAVDETANATALVDPAAGDSAAIVELELERIFTVTPCP